MNTTEVLFYSFEDSLLCFLFSSQFSRVFSCEWTSVIFSHIISRVFIAINWWTCEVKQQIVQSIPSRHPAAAYLSVSLLFIFIFQGKSTKKSPRVFKSVLSEMFFLVDVDNDLLFFASVLKCISLFSRMIKIYLKLVEFLIRWFSSSRICLPVKCWLFFDIFPSCLSKYGMLSFTRSYRISDTFRKLFD